MSENIKVVCRVRPMNEAEKAKGGNFVAAFPSGDPCNAVVMGGKTYTFDNVILPDAPQTEVYEIVAKPIVSDVLNGYNGTVFAYGQTSSGKTYTMEGILNDPIYQGIIPRIVHDIFDHIYQMDENLEFHIKVSYFEIYMEKIRDLLDVSKTHLAVHEDKDRVPYVKGATERFVSSPEEVLDVIDEGKNNRHVAVTNMNEHSSRSHAVFMIQVKQENLETQKKLHGKLYLVDLAGSEKVAKTGAGGTLLDEARNINRSLSSLGNVINALVESAAHVPYRDSKLTRILQESLGGNSRTTMVICVSPAGFNESESKSTLLFGVRAKTIKNTVTINEELTADEWRRRYEREKERNRRMRLVLQGLEEEVKRWRMGEHLNQSDWFTEAQYRAAFADDGTNSSTTSTVGITSDYLTDLDGLTDNTAPGGPSSIFKSVSKDSTTGSVSASKVAPSTRLSTAASVSGLDESELVRQLYQQLDDKDEEINELTQLNARTQAQSDAQEELIKNLRSDVDKRQNEISILQATCDSSKEEVKEVLQALEELAVNYDVKDSELENKQREYDDMQSRLDSLGALFNTTQSDVQQWKEQCQAIRRKYFDIFQQLMADVQGVADNLSDQLPRPNFCRSIDKLDEEFTMMHLHMTKVKSEAKSLHTRINQLEEERTTWQQKHKEVLHEAKEFQMKLQEMEVRVTHLTEKHSESEATKRKLEVKNDELNAHLNELLAREKTNQYEFNRSMMSGQADIKSKLDEEFRRQSEQYQQQILQLRDQLQKKEAEAEKLHDRVNHLTFQNEKITTDLDRLEQDYEVKSKRLSQLEIQAEKREQTEADLKGVEDAVFREFQKLHNLRRLFIQDLQNRVRKSTRNVQRAQNAQQIKVDETRSSNNVDPMSLDEDPSSQQRGSLAQRQKINFLENNLEQLTRVHKQLVRENADYKTEIPKLEKKLKMTMERVKTMEDQLKENKENSVRDRKRYQAEVDRIREHVRTSKAQRRGPNVAQIAKPIRAGHAPSSNLTHQIQQYPLNTTTPSA